MRASTLHRPSAVDPARLQVGEIGGGQIGSDQTARAKSEIPLRQIASNKWPTLECVFVYCSRALAVYTAVVTPMGRWLAVQRGPLFFGTMGYNSNPARPPENAEEVGFMRRRIENRINTVGAEPSQDVS